MAALITDVLYNPDGWLVADHAARVFYGLTHYLGVVTRRLAEALDDDPQGLVEAMISETWVEATS